MLTPALETGPAHWGNASEIFGESYYQTGLGLPYERSEHWLSFFGGIAEQIVSSLRPRRVMDAGCAFGMLVEAFVDRGVECRGIDISPYAIRQVRKDLEGRCVTGNITSGIDGGPYDLVTCIEVLEHIDSRDSDRALDNLCQASGTILFSSTSSDFNEPTHINVQPVSFWLKAFRSRGFHPDISYNASFLAPHAFLVRRGESAPPGSLLDIFAETLELRSQRAAFLGRHEEIHRLREEAASAGGRLLALETKLGETSKLWTSERRQRAETEAALLLARDQLASLTDSLSEWNRRNGELAAAKDLAAAALRESKASNDLATARLTHLEGECTRLRVEAEQLTESVSMWMASAGEKAAALEELESLYGGLRNELRGVSASPGWRLILSYRAALQGLRRRAWFRKYVDPALSSASQKLLSLNTVPNPGPALPERPPLRAAPPAPSPPAHSVSRSVPERLPSRSGLADSQPSYADWIAATEPSSAALQAQAIIAHHLALRPLLSVLVPIYRTPPEVLRAMIASVTAQTYENWELCVVGGTAEDHGNLAELEALGRTDPRIRIRSLPRNEGISASSNAALDLVQGDYIVLLDHDDTLAPSALFEAVMAINRDPSVTFLYSDKDQLTADGSSRVAPLFKPKWSPEVMWNANYLTHMCVMRSQDVRRVGGWRTETDGAQDWDLFLRVTSLPDSKVHHIPKVLYHWRQLSTSVAAGGIDAKPYAAAGQIRAVADHCARAGMNVDVKHGAAGDLHLIWKRDASQPCSVILVSDEPGDLSASAAEILENSDWPNLEVVYQGTPAGRPGLRSVQVPPSATALDRLRLLVGKATGNLLIFLDSAARPLSRDWVLEMTGPLACPEIGIVGSRILDPDTGNLRHCGLVITAEGAAEAIHAGQPPHLYETFGGANWYRNWSAVAGGCMALRRDTWAIVEKGAGSVTYPRLDVQICLTIRAANGQRILYNPFAVFHMRREPALAAWCACDPSRALAFVKDVLPDGDPFFHPSLVCKDGQVRFKIATGSGVQPVDYAADSRALVRWFDADRSVVQRAKRGAGKHSGPLRNVTWLLPEFTNPYYGGVLTILRFADAFRRHGGIESRFCFLGDVSRSRMARLISDAFPALNGSAVLSIETPEGASDLPAADAAICSLWTTAYALARFDGARGKFYLMQDDETLFYPAGSTSALVEATYQFGFRAICNTMPLLRRYEASGGRGHFFTPCVDTRLFHAMGRAKRRQGQPYTVFCYARPRHARNCFELITEAMSILKGRMKHRVQIFAAGDTWNPRDFGLSGIIENLGVLDYAATGALYRGCDAGTALMMTRHPSYLPMELMACGALVIANRNPDTQWLLRDGENCLLAEPAASSLAERIEEGLLDASMSQRIVTEAQTEIARNHSNWDAAASSVLEYLRGEFEND